MNTNIWEDFQICVSVPLKINDLSINSEAIESLSIEIANNKSKFTWDSKWTYTGLKFHFGVKCHFGVK